jgi:DNA polymerase elongation subunit (family B)
MDVSEPGMLTIDSSFLDDKPIGNLRSPCEICVFGITAKGNSVAIRVAGFMPHFYVELTRKISVDVVKKVVMYARKKFHLDQSHVTMKLERKKRVYGWVPNDSDPMRVKEFVFVRISCHNGMLLRILVNMFLYKNVISLKVIDEVADVSEAKVDISEKFLAAHNLKPSGWAQIPALGYEVVGSDKRISVSQLEVKLDSGKLTALDIESIAPIVIASVDIEAHSSDFKSFPNVNNQGDEVTLIGTTFWVYGDSQPRERVTQVLRTFEKPANAGNMHMQSFDTEYELLTGWRDLIAIHGNPDVMVSYNGTGFDYAYMASRLEFLLDEQVRTGVNPYRVCRFNYLGRILATPHPLDMRVLSSSAKGENIINSFPQPGRIQLDMSMYVRDTQKLSCYKLDYVCEMFLEDKGKVVLDSPGWVRRLMEKAKQGLVDMVDTDDTVGPLADAALEACPTSGDYTKCNALLHVAVNHVKKTLVGLDKEAYLRAQNVMDLDVQPALDASGDNNYIRGFRMFVSGPVERGFTAVYCQVDCDLVVMLMDRLNVIANTFQMSQVCNTLADDVCNRGQQIKTFNLISRFASDRGYVMNHRDSGYPAGAFKGATVLEPTAGYYQTPVATLDFASLYPSLMRGYNLCPSSLVLDDEYKDVPGVKYGRYDIAGKTWVFQESTPGLLPDILGLLLDARRAKKREMKQYAKGSLNHRLCDGAQLALKVSCNSVYGFCGANKFPCLPVAVATTYNGRNAIAKTKKFVEDNYNATVIYGDTDSVMLTFPGVTTVPAAFELGERVARETTSIFPKAVVLEFEKVFYPYLLIKCKTYSGMKYEDDPHAPPCLDVKGLAAVRRDNCELVRDVMKQVLHLTMHDNNPQEAYNVVARAVQDLVADTVPLSRLQITNSLKSDESYSNDAQPQLMVVKKMRARKAFGIPRPGDRVPFVITENRNLPRVSDRAEDPMYMEDHPAIRVDTIYYLTKQLEKRLEGILSLLPVPDVKRLFSGAVEQVKSRGVDASSIYKVVTAVERKRTNTNVIVPMVKRAPKKCRTLGTPTTSVAPKSKKTRVNKKAALAQNFKPLTMPTKTK